MYVIKVIQKRGYLHDF